MQIIGEESCVHTQQHNRRTIPESVNVFSVPLSAYAFQPWSNRHPNLSQWFNYGLTPSTWERYAADQLAKHEQNTTRPLSADTSRRMDLADPGSDQVQTRAQTRG